MATVEVSTTEVIVPAEATPAGTIWLSNLDQVAVSYTATVYFYRSNGEPGFFAADAVKDSLTRALVAFYPLAGRLGLDVTGHLQIDCTGEGAVFVTARSDHYALDDLMSDFVPCKEMRDLFVPPAPPRNPACALLLVQVTHLRCGGVVLGLALHHSVADARSAAHFVQAWASLARGVTTVDAVAPPCFDHTPLAARPARTVLYDHLEYKLPVHAGPTTPTYATAIISLAEQQVSALKARCEVKSTFRAVVALVWQCACRARALPAAAETRLYSVIDMRPRLAPALPPGYFGNAVVRSSTVAAVGEVVSNPVSYAARLARAATSKGDDYARSLVDYLEGLDTMNLPASGISPADLWAVSWMGMSLCDPDFGWGTPAFMGPALMYFGGLLYVMNAAEKDGAVTLVLSLEAESMPEFRKMFAEDLARLDV